MEDILFEFISKYMPLTDEEKQTIISSNIFLAQLENLDLHLPTNIFGGKAYTQEYM